MDGLEDQVVTTPASSSTPTEEGASLIDCSVVPVPPPEPAEVSECVYIPQLNQLDVVECV